MASLTELMNDWRELKEMLLDPDVDEDAIRDTMEGLEGALEDKADGYAVVMEYLRADIEMIKAEQERLRNRRLTMEKRIEMLKDRLAHMMTETGKTKFSTAYHNFSIAKNPPKLVIDHEDLVPPKYLIPQDPKVDTALIKEDMKNGEMFTWAHLEQGESLRIR